MKILRMSVWLWLVLLAAVVQPAIAEDAETFEAQEAWYVLKLGGQKAGHMHTKHYEDQGKLVTTTEMILAIKRGEIELRIEQRSKFVETKDYKPVRSDSAMKLALMDSEQSIDFTGDKWVVTATNAGQTTKTEVNPPEGDWLTPGGVAAYTKQAIDRGDETIKVTTLDPSMGVKPVTVEMNRGESKDIEVFGRIIPATRWTMNMTAAPGIEIEQWTDESGTPVRQMIPMMPGMEVEMLLADEQLATAEFDAPEMLASSLITPDKPIANPRKLNRAVFELVADDLKKSIGDTIASDSYQHTKWVGDNTLRVTIDLTQGPRTVEEEIDPVYLNATSMLNFEDKVIRKLMKEALVKEDFIVLGDNGPLNTATLAESMRKKVREHIEQKDLSVGFASASEVARTGKGDCTEHACLLSAMLRGYGIPSRTVTGLVYADQFAGHEGVFGFHMWSQALIKNVRGEAYWLDLDAAAPGAIGGFDATHIALSTSAMKEGETFNEMVTLLPLMQGMEIKVIETQWAD